MEKKDLYVGMKLYYPSGNEAKEITIEKIGNKYFQCEGWWRYKFSIETLKYESDNYPQSNIQLYVTAQEILDKKEKDELFQKIRKLFDWNNPRTHSLEQLRGVNKILFPND